MIVYNVQRRFFEMKAAANAHRRAQKLPASAVTKIEIRDRTTLADFLNALVAGRPAQGVAPIPLSDDACEFIPEFMRRDHERRQKFREARR